MFRSRYSYIFKTSKGVCLIYVSKENSFLECDNELYSIVSKMTPGKMVEKKLLSLLSQEVLYTLKSVGFLCDESEDDDYIDKFNHHWKIHSCIKIDVTTFHNETAHHVTWCSTKEVSKD